MPSEMTSRITTSRLSLLAEGDVASSRIQDLGNTPYWMMAGYLLLLLVLGIVGWRKSKVGEVDYYLAGREQGWLVSSLTIMATFFSSFALLGAPGMVYKEGVVFALFSLNVPVAGLCVYLLGARIWRLGRHFGYITPGDMVADYYGSRASLRGLVALTGFLYAIPYVVMQIQAGGLVTQELFPGDRAFEIGAIVLAAITMLYIMIGGMRSVAWTDLIQGLLLISGMLVAGGAMLLVFDGPAEFGRRIREELPDASQTSPGNSGFWTWTMVFSVCLLSSSGSMVQPAQWMRYYSARGEKTLRRGAVIFAIVLTSCFILGVMLIGLAGQILYPLKFQQSVDVVATDQQGNVDRGPAELDAAVPESLANQFQYEPPDPKDDQSTGKVTWTWLGRNKNASGDNPDAGFAEEVHRLSSNPAFTKAVDELQTKVADGKPTVLPNPEVDPDPADRQDFDAILVVVLNKNLPAVLGSFGALFASLLLIAIMAASMSTADSNLHALSAVLTRDVYDQFIRPKASERERVWVGRGVIVGATVLALVIVITGRNPTVSAKYDFMNMIAKMGLMAIAFAAQLLPITCDILFLRKGTGRGAAAGLAAGLLGAFLFGPLFQILNESLGQPALFVGLIDGVASIKGVLNFGDVTYGVDGSVWGLIFNVPIFIVVSLFTAKVPQTRKTQFASVMASSVDSPLT